MLLVKSVFLKSLFILPMTVAFRKSGQEIQAANYKYTPKTAI